MSTLINSSIISKETLAMFENNLVLGNRIDWSYTDKFGKADGKIGITYGIRRPVMPNVKTTNLAWDAALANVIETQVTITVGAMMTAPMLFDDMDLALRIDQFSSRYIKPISTVMASKADQSIAEAVSNCAEFGNGVQTGGGWVVGTAGTAIVSDTLLEAKQLLMDSGCPDEDIFGVLTPKAMREITNAQIGFFNAQDSISKLYKKGYIGVFAGVDFAFSQSLSTHTNGGVSALTIGAGSAVLTAGWAETGTFTVTGITATINPGDVFKVAGVYQVNPATKVATSNLQQFTVVKTAVSGATSVVVSPAPITAGAYQNISTTVASKTASLVGAAGSVNAESIVLHKSAIAAASPELVIPNGKDEGQFVRSEETSLGLRYVRVFDALGAAGVGGVGTAYPGFASRVDSIYGIKIVRPEWIVRVRN